MSRRVVVTGMGLISPLGNSVSEFWTAIAEQRGGIRPLQALPTENLPIRFGGEAWNFAGEIDDFGPLEKKLKRNIRKGMKVMCREIAMGVAAAQLALHHSGLQAESRDPDRVGVVFGSDYIMTAPDEFTSAVQHCVDENGDFHFEAWAEEGVPRVDPLWLLKYLPNMPASHIAIYNDLRGPNNSITLREASSNLALAEAFCTISRGAADALLAGATGTRVHPLRTLHVIMQEQVSTESTDANAACRPFDRDRSGLVVGEGAGCLMLEELDHARSRGAQILAEVAGYGSSTVVSRDGKPRGGQAIVNAMRHSLATSGMVAEDVGHLHANGMGTKEGDLEEALAIAEVFGENSLPVTALKSYTGNTGAGSGVIELAASILGMDHGQLPPVISFANPDPACPINVNRKLSTSPGDSCLSVNASPQGQASAILVKRYSD